MKAIYFATRTLARNAVNELNGKFKDMGTDAPKGERWAVLVEETPAMEIQTSIQEENSPSPEMFAEVMQSNLVDFADAVKVLNQPGSIIGEQVLRTPNNKPAKVLWRRNKTAMRLAHHMEATA